MEVYLEFTWEFKSEIYMKIQGQMEIYFSVRCM